MEEKRTLEQVFSELDDIVEALQAEETSLDDSIELYSRGVRLMKESGEMLAEAEKKVLQIDEEGNTHEF